jgi:nucleoside-diphosphate-sugar epimerase
VTTPARHVVFGTGAVGLATMEALLRRGETVRMVNRSGAAAVPAQVEVVRGDAADPAFTVEVARGAGVVYQTLNPPYARWVEEWPGLQAGVLAAAQAHGARLVSMENVYMYGRPAGRPLTEDRAYAARTTKGRLRARLATELLAAHEAGRVEVAIGRASDYFGPRGGAQSNLGDRLFPAALAGRTASVLGDPDQPHTYTYIPDIGEGLAVLGEHPAAPGQVWHLPNDPVTRTTRQLAELVFALVGGGPGRDRQVPPLVLRLVALVNPTVRELLEMQYQFAEPFVVDSTKIAALGAHATPVEQALADTLASYRSSQQGGRHDRRRTTTAGHRPRTDDLAAQDRARRGRALPAHLRLDPHPVPLRSGADRPWLRHRSRS